ncbi:MAG: putative glycoside hydrolase [Bacteroidales bacterium]|nr:putative glycoside hydrolase [Bacteroidales bacterium]
MRKIFFFSAIAGFFAVLLVGCGGSKAKKAETAQDSTLTSVKHPEWSRNAVIYEVNLRQYTDSGTITAFAEQLPRLKDLGVDILWFMPIYPISELNRKGELGSYYAVKDYKAFNPEFGTIDQFKEVVKQAHAQGMKVILDWVPNHSGCDNAWVTEHPDWYAKDENGKMFGPYDWTDVYKFDYSNPEMRAAMVDAFKFWLTEVGVDGFRCDVAMEVPVDFWDETRPQLEAVKPDLFMLAEASVPALQKNGFDMGYNWPMKDLFSEIAATSGQYTFKGENGEIRKFPVKHAIAIDSLLAKQAQDYPGDTYLMNMITNHDLNSWEGTEFERLGNLQGAFAVLSYTLPGMPLIYTGQETGMNRAFEFFKKDTPPTWEPRNEYFTFYQKLNALKHNQSALKAGNKGAQMVRYATESPDLYIFERGDDNGTVLVMVNLGAEELPIAYKGQAPSSDGLTNYFTGETEALPASLAPGEYRVYTK